MITSNATEAIGKRTRSQTQLDDVLSHAEKKVNEQNDQKQKRIPHQKNKKVTKYLGIKIFQL